MLELWWHLMWDSTHMSIGILEEKKQQQQQQKTVPVAASYFTSVTGLCFPFSDMFNFF